MHYFENKIVPISPLSSNFQFQNNQVHMLSLINDESMEWDFSRLYE